MLYIFNTLVKKKEFFESLESEVVKMYHCGPTVYDYAHIGNLRAYVFADILRRTMEYNGFDVKQVINITDVGHLVSDSDEGEDKMTQAIIREGKHLTLSAMREVANIYTDAFVKDLVSLHIKPPHEMPRASEHIKEDIALIEELEKKSFVYKLKDGLYFDTSKYPKYGILGFINLKELRTGARVHKKDGKRSPSDFSVWKLSVNDIGWESPWGRGFPGWHIECSAMAKKYLGQPFDIHTGGIEHIGTHHNNEIAQSESAYGTVLARYWLHHEHILIEGKKMAKSEGNALTLKDVTEKGFSPLAYRYWLLTAHYRSIANFTWNALQGAHNALENLYKLYKDLGEETGEIHVEYKERFLSHINNDLNTPQALALLWELIKDKTLDSDCKKATLLNFDKVLGLGLDEIFAESVPLDILELVSRREEARAQGNWAHADEIRDEIKAQGYIIEDTFSGPKINRN